MMNKRLLCIILLLSGTFILFLSCSKDSDPQPDPVEPGSFDKTAMLTHYADNLIIPAYQKLQGDITALLAAAQNFANDPSPVTQDAARVAYKNAHLQYENVEVYNFGPAGTNFLDLFTNFSGGLDYSFTQDGELTGFSIDSTTIESNISTGVYDLSVYSRTSFYAQGFPALNYLLFSPGAISRFESNGEERSRYINAVVARMQMLVDNVVADWATYRTAFVANTKTDVGSPIGNLVNQFAYQMDMMKGPRIGWPFGKQSNGQVFATKTEAYYAGIGSELARTNIKNLRNAFTGGSENKGISGYLISLKQESLNNDVLAQFDALIGKLNAIPDPLSESFITEGVKIEDAYKEIQKLLTLLKTDVPSATGVQITFMDNDGD